MRVAPQSTQAVQLAASLADGLSPPKSTSAVRLGESEASTAAKSQGLGLCLHMYGLLAWGGRDVRTSQGTVMGLKLCLHMNELRPGVAGT